MTDNIIDARVQFLSKALIDRLEVMIQKQCNYHCYCLHLEEDGEDFIELRIKDIENNVHTVIDKAPVLVYSNRYENGKPLFEIA